MALCMEGTCRLSVFKKRCFQSVTLKFVFLSFDNVYDLTISNGKFLSENLHHSRQIKHITILRQDIKTINLSGQLKLLRLWILK